MKSPFNYSEVINPQIYTICGVELKSFSLGHYILLEQLQSPFLNDDASAQIDFTNGISHFYLALLICGQTYESNVKMLEDERKLAKTVKVFSKHLLKTMKLDKNWNIYSKLNLFREYLQYFSQFPIYQVETKSNSAPSGIDWKQNLFTIAKNEFGYTDSEILNMPLRRLFYEWCSYAEKNGGIRVQNKMEMEMIENVKKAKQTTV